MAKYGMPYQGSKSRIAKEIIEILPAGGVFYDLFAGGCAITHAAIVSEKWDKVICNDINGMPFEFVKVICGDTEYLHKWVSREDFKTATGLQRLIWSFNNSQSAYLFSKEAEPIKHLFWEIIHLWKIPRLNLRKVIQQHENAIKDFFVDAKLCKNDAKLCKNGATINMNKLENLQSLENLESLERLQSLENLKSKIKPSALDYRSVDLSRPGVVYCDIPYFGTADYQNNFNHADFWAWAESAAKSHQIYVSEITAPDGWKPIWQKKIKNLMGDNKQDRIEKLFVFGGR